MKTRDVTLLFLLALCLTWGGFNLGRAVLGPKAGLDFTQYYVASRMVLEGDAQNIYRTDGYYRTKAASYGAVTDAGETMTNAYPPFAAFCFIPFALLPFRLALLLFSTAGMLALAAGVWAFFADDDRRIRRDLVLAGVLLTFSFFPVYYSLYMGQVNALLFLCLALVLFFARRDRPWAAGFFIAAAALMKIFPAVLLLFFAARRQFKPVAAAIVSMISLTAISFIVCRPSLYLAYVTRVFPSQTEGGGFYRNQGLGGLFARLLTDNGYVRSLGNWPVLAHDLTVVCGALVLMVALGVAARGGAGAPALDLEFGLCLVATLLALPKSWEHYGILLLFAYFPIARMLAQARPIPQTPLLLTFLSFCVWTILFPQGTDYTQLPRSLLMQPLFSAKCLATVMLLIACVWFSLRTDRTKPLGNGSQPTHVGEPLGVHQQILNR